MKKLDPDNQLFNELQSNPPGWWKTLVNDKDAYIDIRKDNYIDVYFNGGNLIRELKFNGTGYTGKIHYKYLLPKKAEYIEFDFQNQSIDIANKEVKLIPLNNLDKDALKRIKDNISIYHPANSEKGIQAKFVKNTGFFLDSEFAYTYNGTLRVDLVWIDTSSKKIILVELKTMGDKRLYTNEIHDQLKKYHDFATSFTDEITEYYSKVYEIKKKLNILSSSLENIQSLKGYTLETKPLLIFGDCEQKWIEISAKDINNRIQGVAVGAYYFGKPNYNCDIISKPKEGNRYKF
jgi:hypothetical protein